MAENGGRLLGLFDELAAFLTKIRLYNSRGLSDSHELAMFLELYNANPWTRTTGEQDSKYIASPDTKICCGGKVVRSCKWQQHIVAHLTL